MSDLPPFNPYDVLGVDKDADAASIKKAYRKLALIKHPDKCADETLKQIRTDEFQRLNEAYDILGDDEKRKRHDALVKLEALRKEKFAMGGPPRPFARAATFQNAYPGSTGTAYTSRGATNVEDRVPKGFYEEEDRYRRRSSNEYDYPRRSAGGTARADRTRAERDEERRRNERRRDESVREARSRKYDEPDYHDERDWKREDPRDKYETWEESLKAYTTNRPGEARPTMGRRTSTTQVPRNVYATRSRAEPKEGRTAREDRDIFEKERDLQREQERLARLKEEVRLRDEAKERRRRDEERDRRYEQERSEKAARREAERQEAERRREQEQRDQERERERERLERETRRRTGKENVEPYERRPPQLQHNHSSPPNLPEGPPIRVRTDPVSSDSIPHPSMTRSSTMPSVPLSNSSARRTATGPSKLRETLQPDSGYSSNSSSEQRPGRTSAKNVKRHYYTVNHEPIAPTRRRSPSPERERERPSMERASSKMANLAKHALRPGVSDYRSGSYSLPSRPRSPERTRRERDYERPQRPLYGERTGSFVEGVKFAKPITEEDISYSRRERDAYPYSASQRFDRRGNGVVPPTPQ